MFSYEPVTAQDLDEAADLLERDGWCQHHGHNGAGEYCLVAAVAAVRGRRLGDRYTFASVSLAEALDLVGNPEATEPRYDGVYFPHLWNDRPRRTKEEVVARLRRGAEKLRAQAQ